MSPFERQYRSRANVAGNMLLAGLVLSAVGVGLYVLTAQVKRYYATAHDADHLFSFPRTEIWKGAGGTHAVECNLLREADFAVRLGNSHARMLLDDHLTRIRDELAERRPELDEGGPPLADPPRYLIVDDEALLFRFRGCRPTVTNQAQADQVLGFCETLLAELDRIG